ncbi:hypothetical protein FG386_000225 [Cryptosporidium ryanae]|uniref:uncharacterized protein n=1 Tax=Cryptosporidium ryanae TaxID=515981 RepID=UPI00351A382A|nr:hypothetical protein FG386_000225 [Cryptosporidium ryanae]
MSHCVEYKSELVNRSYWEEFYENELGSYKDVGYRGEEWFEEYIDSIVDWIDEILLEYPTKKRILDVGCGNGMFLISIFKSMDNFESGVGIDYVPSAIELAKKIVEEESLSEQISLFSIDLVSGKDVLDENAIVQVDLGKFEVIVDKGTYDVFVMKNEVNIYKESIVRYLKKGSILFITSCNSTPYELTDSFDDHVNFVKISDLPHKSYSYNGTQGQVLASVAFKCIKED